MRSVLGVAILATLASAEPNVMNKGGIPYQISNPPGATKDWKGTPGNYSVDFMHNVKGKVEYFDVYGEVRTKYSQVYWTRNAPINLPKELVDRFNGKVMAITGYEVDQVTHEGPQTGSTTTESNLGGFSCYPECSQGDRSIPSYHAYNHHYFSWLVGSDAEVYDRKHPVHIPNPTSTGVRDLPHGHEYPTNIVFKENPGGEFRKSYHGYPGGFAQLIHSPKTWLVEPMQIDTHNRKFGINSQEGYTEWFLPKRSQGKETDRQNGLSPLIECPCTDRITLETVSTPTMQSQGTCHDPVANASSCFAEVQNIIHVNRSSTIDDAKQPWGCLLKPTGDHYEAIFNKAQSTKTCESTQPMELAGQAQLGQLTNLTLHTNSSNVTITISGPDAYWFGVGFNAQAMSALPYAVIVEAGGRVSERKLENHGPGKQLKASVTLLSSTVSSSIRTVTLTRSLQGLDTDHYTFPSSPGQIDVITAVGSTPTLSYHKAHTGGKIMLLPQKEAACVCQPTQTHFLNYMNKDRSEFEGYACADEPRSDMLKHGDGTGRNVSNAACHPQTYHGGLQCCKNQYFLTDLEQDHLIPNETDIYFLKWRYYFQEYLPASSKAAASHKHLHHWVFLIDEQINDYEEDSVQYGTESVGRITAHVTGKEMGLEDVPVAYTTITPLVMTPHCHAPSCLREELWNADTGEIICNVTARYGSTEYGSVNNVFNEANYIALPPCIFGYQPGLQKPFTLTPSTRLTAIKYFNNTFRHLGQMAQWVGLMVYDSDPIAEDYVHV
ncbi:unnamed protein product [Symbiodinium pilosum]|uniref:Uncharacterized protein n=1 Tax=Symbiodinium pilosum TaxID=2952 RepID=A0A812V0X8_SYMPI|nr:unnamed protein product [Symbiodinium pilosum]